MPDWRMQSRDRGEIFAPGGEDTSLWSVLGDVARGRPGSGLQVSAWGPGRGVAASDKNVRLDVYDDLISALEGEYEEEIAQRARRWFGRTEGEQQPNRRR